eukprot:8751687-Alexandrium_andersonii.AAC.1
MQPGHRMCNSTPRLVRQICGAQKRDPALRLPRGPSHRCLRNKRASPSFPIGVIAAAPVAAVRTRGYACGALSRHARW